MNIILFYSTTTVVYSVGFGVQTSVVVWWLCEIQNYTQNSKHTISVMSAFFDTLTHSGCGIFFLFTVIYTESGQQIMQ